MLALNNALVPQIIGPGLNVSTYQGVILLNGGLVSFPTTVIGLLANKTTWIFVNTGSGTIQSNNTGFISNCYPIAVVTTSNVGVASLVDSRPDYILTPGSGGGLSGRFILNNGTLLNSGNFTLNNWGSGASISVTGRDSAHTITVTAGTGAFAGATVQLTFADGAWNSPPMVFSSVLASQTGAIFPITSVSTTTTYTLTFQGLPLNGKTYSANILVCGLA